MILKPIRYFQDNYCYLFKGITDACYSLVDPGETDFIFSRIVENSWRVDKIFLTHRHHDHIGDLPRFTEMLSAYNKSLSPSIDSLSVYASSTPSVKLPDLKNVADYVLFPSSPSELKIPNSSLQLTATPVPCHTRCSMLYQISCGDEKDLLFTGDTVFKGGVGRFFEGDAQEMLRNIEIIQKVAPTTLVCTGHDYELSNLNWSIGLFQQGGNDVVESVKQRVEYRQVDPVYSEGEDFRAVSTVAEEISSNVFFHCNQDWLKQLLGAQNDIQAMHLLREYKNQGKSFGSS